MTGTATNPEFQDNATGQIKRQVAAVDNVQQVRSVLWGNSVVIAVTLENNDQEKETKRAIQNAVKPFVGGRSVQVLTDEGILGRDRNGPDHNRNNDIQHYEHNGNKEVKNPSP
jgi:spore cortex protein